LPRILDVDEYLDYITNRTIPDLSSDIRSALETLWSASALPGSTKTAQQFQFACTSCDLPGLASLDDLTKQIFMIMLTDFMDPWTFNVKNLMKCCKEILLPDGRQIPFCAYNNVGYREAVTAQLHQRKHATPRQPASTKSTTPPLFHHRDLP
jgi:uncharacterized radical SAM superfamily Fe-S cluster-containing enzyme